MAGTRKLGRPTAHRKAMLRGMVTYLLENGQIETTLTRAKEVRSMAEKMITLGKKNTLASRRQALAYITKEDVVTKVFSEIAPKYADRNGGYTAIYKLGAEETLLKWHSSSLLMKRQRKAPNKVAAKFFELTFTYNQQRGRRNYAPSSLPNRRQEPSE